MSIFSLIILVLMMAAFAYFKIGDIFSPWMITVGVWAAIMFMFLFEQDLLDPISDQFYISLWIWVPIMTSSALLTYKVLPKVKDEAVHLSEISFNPNIFLVLFILSVIFTPVYLYQILKVVTMFDTTDLFYNIRIYAVYGNQDFGILKYLQILNQALFIVAIWHYPKVPLWQVLTLVFCNLLCTLAIMEKGIMFNVVFITLFVFYQKQKIKLRTIAFTGIAIILIFFAINIMREIQSEDNSESVTFLDFIAIYILSPAVAFGKVTENLSTQFGSRSFEFFYAVFSKLGLGRFEVEQKLQEFVWVPLPTNVYTVFQPFYQDFQYKGIAFFALIYGLVSGYLYRLFHNGSTLGRCLYAYLSVLLILQFYQENLIMSISLEIQSLFFLVLLTQQYFKIDPFSKINSTS